MSIYPSWPGKRAKRVFAQMSRPSTSLNLRHKKGRRCPDQVRARRQLKPEGQLMDSLNPESSAALAPVIPTQRPQKIGKFWSTALWGLFIFAAMFVGQITVMVWFLLRWEGP